MPPNNKHERLSGEEGIPFFPTVTEITLLKHLHSLNLGCIMGDAKF